MLLLFFQSKSNLIPVLVTLGAATVKLIPSINKIIDSIQQIKYFNPSVVKVTNSLKEPIEKRLTKVEAYNSINFVNISLKYEKEYIIKNLNWNIELSKFLGLKGISGSGKTSLINLLFGFIKQNTGQILVDNTLLGNNKYIANIGYVPQKVNLVDGSFAENIAFGEDKIDYEKLKRIIIDCKLDDLINENNFNIKVNEYENKLSGGQIQRIGIARALYFEPVFLILDESLNSLDIETSNEILNSLLKINKKIGLLIISHDENDFMHCEKIFNIQNGQIIN
jgi:ABC-type bacteriocin/lantibiotic exporter with double-glycine peptidase domain